MEKQQCLFLTAAKMKLRFATTRGHLTTEDLFDLSLKDLDGLAVGVATSLANTGTMSFLENPDRRVTAERAEQTLRLEVIKAIIETKQDDNKARKARADLQARRAFLEGLLEKKQLDAMESLSAADIEAQLAALCNAEQGQG